MEENAGLQRRQRVHVLNVGPVVAADLVNLTLRQLGNKGKVAWRKAADRTSATRLGNANKRPLKCLPKGLNRLSLVQQTAEADGKLQTTAAHTSVHVNQVSPRHFRADLTTVGLAAATKQRSLLASRASAATGVHLAEIVEYDVIHARHIVQLFNATLREEPKPDTVVWHLAQRPLGRLDHRSQVGVSDVARRGNAIDHDGEHGREPANRARQIDAGNDVFASMALHGETNRLTLAPLRESPSKRCNENVVDLRSERRARIAQEYSRFFFAKLDRHGRCLSIRTTTVIGSPAKRRIRNTLELSGNVTDGSPVLHLV